MQVHIALTAPPLTPGDRIAPHQLWPHLSSGQQQHGRQVFISVAQPLVAPRPHPSLHEEMRHDLHASPESRQIDAETS